MRVHYVVLLVVAVLASANATSFATQSKINSPSFLTAQHGVSAPRFLRIHYTEEDDDNEARGIATVVEQAKAMLSSSKISQKTLERWVRSNKSPNNALIRLKLDKAGDKLFENPQFQTWATYMTMLNKQNPEAAMVSTLMTRYSDDVLSQMIIAAEKASATKELTTRLQAGQRSVWLSNWKSADEVFNLLKLNKADGKLFDNPQFTVWTKYVDELNGGDPKKANSVIVSTLTSHHDDESLAKLIRAAKDDKETEKMASDLQNAQVGNWFVLKESPTDVKKWLGVKGTPSDTAEGLLYQKYVNNYEKVFEKLE